MVVDILLVRAVIPIVQLELLIREISPRIWVTRKDSKVDYVV